MRVIAVGRMRDGPEAALFTRYAGRMRPRLELLEIPDGTGSAPEIKRREAAALLAALPANSLAVALDQGGAALDSAGLAAALARWFAAGRPVSFLLGGAEGLDKVVLARADAAISLGALTWPHLLARAMLAEQLYRAQSILQGHPYHRAGRPSN